MLAFVIVAAAAVVLWLTYTVVSGSTTRTRHNQKSIQAKIRENARSSDRLPIKPLNDFVWEDEKPRQFRPFKSIYHITMALQADTPQDLITIDGDYLDRINLRRALLAQHYHTVHGCTRHGGPAVCELYTHLLAAYLPRRYPSIFRLEESDAKLRNRATGAVHATSPPADPEEALRILAETVEEDLFLLRETESGHESIAFVCCFPSGFDPSAKLGRLLSEIHAPVPSYDKIAKSMERFFGKLEVGKSVKRMNWSVQTHNQLFNCKGNHIDAQVDSYTPDEDVDVAKTFVRVELQTLTRLPQTRAILFSFKTYMYPVEQIKGEGSGPEFADAIEGLGSGNAPGMRIYKGSVRWGRAVCEYLRS